MNGVINVFMGFLLNVIFLEIVIKVKKDNLLLNYRSKVDFFVIICIIKYGLCFV